jgi:hypothetical protein
MALRAVADLLVQHRVATKTDKYGFQSLLSLLKAGDIQGVVLFPEISRDPIPVPKSYWMPLGPEALEPLRRIPRRRLTGTYKIKLRDIALEVVRVAFDRPERRIGSDFEQLATRLIKEADQEASVDVLESDWVRFRSALPGSPSEADEKAKLTGRPEGLGSGLHRIDRYPLVHARETRPGDRKQSLGGSSGKESSSSRLA